MSTKQEVKEFFLKTMTDAERALVLIAVRRYRDSQEVLRGDIMDPLDFLKTGYWRKWVDWEQS
jgi:hypothetical protein